jgi:hypothetical protein
LDEQERLSFCRNSHYIALVSFGGALYKRFDSDNGGRRKHYAMLCGGSPEDIKGSIPYTAGFASLAIRYRFL